jgi:hypothetical protein
MRKISERDASKYLKGSGLPEDGSSVLVYIHDVVEEEVRDSKTGKMKEELVLYLADASGNSTLKPYIPNKTNRGILAEDLGDDPAEWPGRQIKLRRVPSRTPEGKPTPGIAVAGVKPPPAQPVAGPPPQPPIVTSGMSEKLITKAQLQVPPAPAETSKRGRSRKDAGNGQSVPTPPPAAGGDDLSDEIPF